MFALLSQLPKPAVQVGTQAPLGHDVVPLAFEHVVPQAPQLAVVVSDVSQPFETLPSQLPKPVLHAMAHDPSAQLAAPLLLLHTEPQAPQFVTLV